MCYRFFLYKYLENICIHLRTTTQVNRHKLTQELKNHHELTHFRPIVPFYTFWKHQKTSV